MIENNKKRESIIIGFNKEPHIEKYSNYQKDNNDFNDIQLKDGFLISEIFLSNSGRNFNEDKKKIFTKTSMMLEDFRLNKLNTSDIFDTDKLAKLMAIKAIFGAGEFDWRDIKFYYNPFNLKLEPIGKEVGAGLLSKNNWWNSNPEEIYFDKDDKSQKSFLNLIFKDKIFFKKYLEALEYFVINEKKILDKILKDQQIKKNINKIKINFPRRHKSFSIEIISKNIKIIKEFLNVKNYVSFNLVQEDNDFYKFAVINSNRLSIEIVGIDINNDKYFLKNKISIPPRKAGIKSDPKFFIIQPENLNRKVEKFNNLKIVFGDISDFRPNVSFLYKSNFSNTIHKSKILNSKIFDKNFDILKKSFLTSIINFDKIYKIDNKNIVFNNGDLTINKNIVIPKNYNVKIEPGTNIYFKNNSSLISFSPLQINGTKIKPVKIISLEKNSINNFILVSDSKKTSNINYLYIKNLSAPKDTSSLITGAINFFNSDVIIKNSIFDGNNFGDDQLNIISSNFLIKDTMINNSLFDAIDIDFSNGKIINSTISRSGNDSVDFSYSKSQLSNVKIDGSGDKAISAGEKSKIDINFIEIEESKIAFASKDNSHVNVQNAKIKNVSYLGAAYQKKPEFGPGYLNIENINYQDVETEYAREPNSKIFVNGLLVKENSKLEYDSF